MPLSVDGPALHTFFSNLVAKGRESVSSAQATISNPPSFLWQMTSEQLVQFGQMNPEQFQTIQSHICELARTLPSATDSIWTPSGLQVDLRSPCGV
jgi:hypothetical protein